MKTLLIFLGGVWIGRQISTILAENHEKAREVEIRQKLDAFMQEKLPGLSATEQKQNIESLLK